jgi:hypothetical protein
LDYDGRVAENWLFFVIQFSSTPPQKGVFLLVLKKRYQLLLIALLLSGLVFIKVPVYAEGASHTLTVLVQEISRYRIESIVRVESPESESVYDISLAVFSNSQRQWNLTAQSEVRDGKWEWSTDNRNWKNLNQGLNTLISGTKANWSKYHIYYRYRETYQTNKEPDNPFDLQYQLCYQE